MKKPLYEETDFGSVRRIYINLGVACNMHCRHCIETPFKNAIVSSDISPKLVQFLKNFISYAIKMKNKSSKFRGIFFWGGEPLLYWKTIIAVIDSLGSFADDFISAGYGFYFTTNGLLLTDDKIEFINKYKIRVNFSYDAPYPWAVRDYISDDIIEKFKKIQYFSINTGYDAYNCDPMLAYRCLKAKFSNAYITFSTYLGVSFNMPKDIYNWNWDKIKIALKKLRIGAQMGDKFSLSYLMDNFNMVNIDRYSSFDRKYYFRESCASGFEKICVFLDGSISSCHCVLDKVGELEDSLLELQKQGLDYLSPMVSSYCKSCRHLKICGGNRCFANLKDTNGEYYVCKDFLYQFYDLFKKEMIKVTLPLSNIDIAWYCEQEKIMEQQVQAFLQEGKRYETEHTRLPKSMIKVNLS